MNRRTFFTSLIFAAAAGVGAKLALNGEGPKVKLLGNCHELAFHLKPGDWVECMQGGKLKKVVGIQVKSPTKLFREINKVNHQLVLWVQPQDHFAYHPIAWNGIKTPCKANLTNKEHLYIDQKTFAKMKADSNKFMKRMGFKV